jgi:ribonuclease P protein component
MSVPSQPFEHPTQLRPLQQRRQSLVGARLCKHADYQRAYAASRKRQSTSMSWFLANWFQTPFQTPLHSASATDKQANNPGAARVGLTVGKVIGKAHERNRIKRRMREALRRHVDLLPSGCDLILHPRRTVLKLEFQKLEAEVVRLLQQAKIEATRMESPNRAEISNPRPFSGAQPAVGQAPSAGQRRRQVESRQAQ